MIGGPALNKALRYAGASLGPIGTAGTQFLLSLVLLRALGQREFGAFSFLLVASQLSLGLWSALFCAPLPILYYASEGEKRAALLKCLFSTNLFVALCSVPLFWLMARALEVPLAGASLFSLYAASALLRWFARAYGYATGAPLRTMASDIFFAIAMLVGIGLILLAGSGSFALAYSTLLVSVLLSLIPFGLPYLRQQFGCLSLTAVPAYAAIWKRHSGWSLVGVLTTEATANAHVYIVTAGFGPTAFAPIAASALLIRPIAVALNALTEFERAQMARAIGRGRIEEAAAAASYFRLAMILIWLGSAVAISVLIMIAPHAIFPRKYDLRFVEIASILWVGVAGIRLLRMPESALLQAAGEFRPLALASVYSSVVSIIAVVGLLLWAGILWSIVGILLGEIVYALWIWRQCRQWLGAKARRELVVTSNEARVA